MNKLPVSIISPVRNGAEVMTAHAKYLREMAAVADEIIIVDSDSTDGTLEILKRELDGLDVLFLNHPPGLYQSWNHALSQARAPYLTVATVGDPLPAESLERLVTTMERFSADAVISAPEILDDEGRPLAKEWPIHQLIKSAGIVEAQPIDTAVWMTMALVNYPITLISSSAGNLYRTQMMKDHPFSADFGHTGDSAWALAMSAKAKWVVDPQAKSYFWLHAAAPARRIPNEIVARRTHDMLADFIKANRDFLTAQGVTEDLLGLLEKVPGCLLEKTLLSARYQQIRKSWIPWFLQAGAFRLRGQRAELAVETKKLRRQAHALAIQFLQSRPRST